MKATLTKALTESGKELLRYSAGDTGFRIKESQSSIVTQADIKSDEIIREIITARYPSHNLLSEESGFKNNNSDYTWVIDPLDGTSNFASALPWYGVLITLFHGNEPLMAGAYVPAEDLLYYAGRNEGSFKNGDPFKMDRQKILKNSLCAFSVDYTDDKEVLARSMSIYCNVVKSSRNIRSTNSLMDFLFVAEGKFGGCINLFTRIWDISGLGLIITEAGGMMKYISGDDIIYSLDENSAERNFAVMAGSENIIGELLCSVLKSH
ncbi:MAG: inositol monophosphatase [Bacteroidales bacterium]|nr:inositol monophosphatase [Bacteroidales bacterium]